MPIDTHLKDELEALDQKYGGDEMFRMFGPTLLGYCSTDSSRAYMFTSHLKQGLTLLNPDIPRLQTGFENTIGEFSQGYKKLEGTWEVKAIIPKFRNGQIYTIVFYNKKTDTYEMIEKLVAEHLTEKFGFLYNTEVIDGLKVGDKITDEVIYRTTSYDKNMNYRYGKNAHVMYSTSTDTLEDAIMIRKSWADSVKSVEVDTVQVGVNDNDIFLNLYGDDEHYKPFPDIGESAKNSTLCATRRINKAHLLYDFQAQNMQDATSTDLEYFVTPGSEVYDIDIFYNGDDPFPDNLFYGQLKQYYEDICQYADAIYEWATKIKKSGSNYTKNVSYMRSRYMYFNDPEYKWKHKDKAFSNMLIIFKVKAVVGLDSGSKMTGRYGDKGVISTIVDDMHENIANSIFDMSGIEFSEEEKSAMAKNIQIIPDERMPYSDDCQADVVLNSGGGIRRLNPGQLAETEIGFIAERIQLKIRELPTLEEKEELVFKFLNMVNPEEGDFFHAMYKNYDRTEYIGGRQIRFLGQRAKEAFIKDIEDNGFYLVVPPHKPILYGMIKKCYEEFPWIKPLPIYVNLFGIKKRRVLRDGIIGWKYLLILKQNSNKNFSARSTFRVNRANLPAKDTSKKTNRAAYAKTPVRLSEIYGLMAAISGTELAKMNIFLRSSALGRKSLSRILAADGNPLAIKKLKIKDNFTNANADILNARLKAIGLRLVFKTNEANLPDLDFDYPTNIYIDGFTIMDVPSRREMYTTLFALRKKYASQFTMVEAYPGEKEEVVWEKVFADPECAEFNLSEEDKKLLIETTKAKVMMPAPITKPKQIVDEIEDEGDNPVIHRRKRRKKKTDDEEA